MDRNPDSVISIAGDANFSNIRRLVFLLSGNNYPVHLCAVFLDFIQDCGLTQTVNFPTRSANTLDIFITNWPSLVLNCKPLAGFSDHDIVYIESTVVAKKQSPPSEQCYKFWNRTDNDTISDYITTFTEQFLGEYDIHWTTYQAIDTLWNVFKEMCYKCLDMIPSRTHKTGTSPPWMNPTIKRLSYRKQRLYNFARQFKSADAWQRYRQIKKEVQHACQQAHNSYIHHLVTPGKHSTTKRLWSYIKN